ncbi:MAG: ribosomal-processing cysteine protease Prp [Oscillospiraceae bacterium]|nr:ribosomal-processing cysteine protease Prp [Oscillospiraceae bacterium]
MVTVKFNKKGNRHKITIEGHAGYNPGLDIVCSAVSMLSFTLLQALKDEHENGNLRYLNMRHDSGNVHVVADTKKLFCERLQTIINTIFLGFELLAAKYPEHVELLR